MNGNGQHRQQSRAHKPRARRAVIVNSPLGTSRITECGGRKIRKRRLWIVQRRRLFLGMRFMGVFGGGNHIVDQSHDYHAAEK